MSYKSTSTAKLLLVALVAIGSTSVYFGKQWASDLSVAQSNVVQKQRAVKDAERAYRDLQVQLTPDERSLGLDEAMANVILDVFNKRLDTGVTVTTTAPGKFSVNSGATPLDTLVELVPGTKVKTVRLNVRGTFSRYLGLQEYIRQLQSNQVSIVRLKVSDQSFELGLRVYGSPQAN